MLFKGVDLVVKRLSLGLGLGWAIVGFAFGLLGIMVFENRPIDYVDVLVGISILVLCQSE